MPSKYQPTGNPRGRPKAAAEPAPEPVRDARALLKETTVDRAHRPMQDICRTCFPLGWMPQQLVTCCEHGIWVKR